jgi:hypothetical protein
VLQVLTKSEKGSPPKGLKGIDGERTGDFMVCYAHSWCPLSILSPL